MTELKRGMPPSHPGDIIKHVYMDELSLSEEDIARAMRMPLDVINALVHGKISIAPDMAVKLSVVLSGSPESWLNLQMAYDLWHAKKNVESEGLVCLVSKG